MSLVYWLQEPGGTLLDVTDRCQFDMEEKAEEGSVAVNTLVIDDPLGDLDIFGHRILAVEETTAVDEDDRFVFVGFIGTVKTIRGPSDRTGTARQYVCEVSDANTILSRRVMRGDDNDRPEETDNERIEWVLTTHESNAIDDTRYVTSGDPWDMDEADYLLQDALAIYADCSQQSGKNYFVTYFGDTGVDPDVNPWGVFSLWYEHASAGEYNSTATLSNYMTAVDVETGNFYIGLQEETHLSRDPMRIYSDVTVPYKESYASASNPTTRSTYARRDKVMPAINVKNLTTAQARAQRYVNDLATPEDRATVKTTVPRSLVNLIRPGMQVPVMVSHWPAWDDVDYAADFVWMRVLSRRVKEIAETEDSAFELTLVLSIGLPGPPPTPVYGILRGSGGPYDTEFGTALVYWANPGDTPGPGYPLEPTTGPLTVLTDGTPPKANRTHYGWQIDGNGTIDVTAFLTVYGIIGEGIVYTWTMAICKNGTPVASIAADFEAPVGANMASQGWDPIVSVASLAVSNGDEITVTLETSDPRVFFWRTPRGTGQNGERLEITDGALS